MLWDPGSVEKSEDESRESASVTPILVPLQSKPPPVVEKSVPVVVPDVQDLKDQFQQQQNMLTQIKETLTQEESQFSIKEKQVEIYADKLSQIRARSKNNQAKKLGGLPGSPKTQRKTSRENLAKQETSESSVNNSKNRKGKISELKKRLEENKIKFEQRAGKEQFEAKKIETLVEQLKMQLEERDKTIQDLQKTIEEPTPKIEFHQKPKAKLKEPVASKTTQTSQQNQPTEDSNEIVALQNKIHELEANVLDLEENLKEKESVIEARTQAVTLLSQDLSLKGKNALESLEETRQEMRTMQNNFIAVEDQLKKDLVDRDSRVGILEEKCKKLESTNFELSLINAEQQEKLVNLQEKYLEADAERKSLKESTAVQGLTDVDKLDELTKKINVLMKELDDRNKSMIKMKIEHKNKIKNLNKMLETLKGTSDEKAEIVRLRSLLEEFENVKTTLENRVAELEDEKASEKNLKDEINELEIIIKKQNEDLALHLKTISNLERENLDLLQSNQEKTVQVENLQSKVLALEALAGTAEGEAGLSQRLELMEAEYNRKIEELKGEHRKEVETLESYYFARGEALDRKTLEEYRISSEMNNIHVEEQIELLIREKQQLLEKLKSLSGVSSTDSLTFEKMEHSDLKDMKEAAFPLGEEVDLTAHQPNRTFHLEKIVSDQQHVINDLQKTIAGEKEKVETYQQRIAQLEDTIKELEGANVAFKQQIEMSESGESGKSTKTNTNTKNRIKKIEMELSQSKKTIQEQSEKLNELSQKLQEKEEIIKNYSEKIELFEKDDWDRQNSWKNVENDMESMQELQKKCLSLENSLYELNEHCERLRKENIEVVHLLSEEKVKRRKLLEELEAKDAETQKLDVEERIKAMSKVIQELEEKIERIESSHQNELDEGGESRWEAADLQEKLEWTNVVLTSKETEIFRLQNLLEDRNSLIEVLEMDLKESKKKLAERENKLGEIIEELKAKEVQLAEISANFDKLQLSVDVANQKTATNETQLEELLATVKEMEGDVVKKETELQEIKGILAEKNLDMTNLRNRLEEVNSDLTHSYQEHLENMGKCLRDKESDYDALLAEKTHLEEVNRNLVSEREDAHNQKLEMTMERDKLRNLLLEKEKLIAELNEKLQQQQQQDSGGEKDKSQELEDYKIKMKKLVANLKKKAQNEADLLKQMKELEGHISEKDQLVEKLEAEVKEVTEKWTAEKAEKETLAKELEAAVAEKAALETESEVTRQRMMDLEGQFQVVQDICRKLQAVEQEDKGKIAHLESKTAELCQLYEGAIAAGKQNEEAGKEREILLGKLAEVTGHCERLKFERDQVLLEKCEMEKRIEEMQKALEVSLSEKSSLDGKMQENFAVIESLEVELKKTRDQLKTVEEKFFYSEERRSSLESKNEEMISKMMENSENLITIDDLSVRVDELLKSEKSLQTLVKDLETGNGELKQALDLLQTENFGLEKDLKAANEKITEMAGELKELKNADGEKNNVIRGLSAEVEKLKAENQQIRSEFDKLNRDYEQFENDFKENLEYSQDVEKSLKHKIEELLTENASLAEKCNVLSDEKHQSEKLESDKPKKRKSVTFRTDEVEYIKELKNKLHTYDTNLKRANEEIENLKADLLRERLRLEVANVVAEAQEKVESLRSTPEKRPPTAEPLAVKTQNAVLLESPQEQKFDAKAFFGSDGEDPFLEVKTTETQQSFEFESLMWDDGWGAEGHLEAEYLSEKVVGNGKGDYELRIKKLETEMKSLQEENDKLGGEIKEQTAKYAKAIKKLKEVKAAHDKLLSEVNKLRSSSGFGDLDAAIVEELKSQIESMEAKEKELLKNLENSKLEKESLLKRIEVLNEGNEKFLEMKERQDNNAEIWQRKNSELLKEISELRQQLQTPEIVDDSQLMAENRELKNKVEALEWKNCELSELLEEKEELLEKRQETADVEKVMKEKSELQKEIEELNNVRELLEKKLFDEEKKNTMTIGELNEQLSVLATENETLQDILGEMKKTADAAKKKESKIFDYFKFSPGGDLFSVGAPSQQQEEVPLNVEKQKITDLENLIKQKEEELNNTYREVESLRQRLSTAEDVIRSREEELNHSRIEKENEVTHLRQNLMELENLIKLKDAENIELREKGDREIENLKKKIKEVEAAEKVKDQFETIDLNQEAHAVPENEEMFLRQEIADLETLLIQKDEEYESLHRTRTEEVEGLRERVFQLEDAVKLREEELDRLRNSQNEVEAFRQKVLELENFARYKETELYQVQSVKDNEIQNLNVRIFELENLLRFKEEETRQKNVEIEGLVQRVAQLEPEVRVKNEEIERLSTRVAELEKSYNDSKLEIERLLNEEKLNVEEKFVEPFQENMRIPVAFEVEAMTRTLDEERQKSENLQYELFEKENLLVAKEKEIQNLNSKLSEMKEKLKEETRRNATTEESLQVKAQLEKMVSDLQQELENSNLQLSVTKRELEEFQNVKDEAMTNLKSQLLKLESELTESREPERTKVKELKEKTEYYEGLIKERKAEEERREELVRGLEKEVENLREELERKGREVEALAGALSEERSHVDEMKGALQEREAEVADLRETLAHLQEEIKNFRNFEKQVKELRVEQIKKSGGEVSVTPEGHPDLSNWTEHELAELRVRLQSDLDTALYMLHQRDVRCDELTFELMQLLEERDTLQLRLSTALRINEELRAFNRPETSDPSHSLQENKDLVDQSNDRQAEKDGPKPTENLRQLAEKISELHSVSYLRDKTVKDESVQRHKEQMNLLSRVSDSDITLSRDVQSSPTVLLNWMRGKTTPKVMHI